MLLRLALDTPAAVEHAIPGAEAQTYAEKLERGRAAMISRHTARWVGHVFVPRILPRAECGETDCTVRQGHLFVPIHDVTESARAHSYIFSEEVQKTCEFWLLTSWLLTFWLLTVPAL